MSEEAKKPRMSIAKAEEVKDELPTKIEEADSLRLELKQTRSAWAAEVYRDEEARFVAKYKMDPAKGDRFDPATLEIARGPR